MIRNSLFLGMLLATVTVVGSGCTQNQQGTQKKTAYYHDVRRVPTGSNLPKTYHDTDPAANDTQSDMDRENFQRTQGTFSSAGGGMVPTGGSR